MYMIYMMCIWYVYGMYMVYIWYVYIWYIYDRICLEHYCTNNLVVRTIPMCHIACLLAEGNPLFGDNKKSPFWGSEVIWKPQKCMNSKYYIITVIIIKYFVMYGTV